MALLLEDLRLRCCCFSPRSRILMLLDDRIESPGADADDDTEVNVDDWAAVSSTTDLSSSRMARGPKTFMPRAALIRVYKHQSKGYRKALVT